MAPSTGSEQQCALDLVLNKINEPAAIYRNRAREITGYHYLRVLAERERGEHRRHRRAKYFSRTTGPAVLEQMPTRGFQSSVDPVLHFVWGKPSDRFVIVIWPDTVPDAGAPVRNPNVTLSQSDAAGKYVSRRGDPPCL